MGRLFSPHHIFAANCWFETINLSFGERPVCEPVVAAKAPLAASTPSFRAKACSTNTAGERFQLIFPRLTSPYSSRAFRLIMIVIFVSLLIRLFVEALFRGVVVTATSTHKLCIRVYTNFAFPNYR